jgi:hypothetical protein
VIAQAYFPLKYPGHPTFLGFTPTELKLKSIEQRLASRLPDRGYVCALEVWTLDALPASRDRELAPWVIEDPGGPLAGN